MAALQQVAPLQSVTLPLDGFKVCVLSTIPISTSRIVNRQCRALANAGAVVTLLSPNPKTESHGRFATRHFPCSASALGRLLTSPRVLRPALDEHADIYHVHTFQLVPMALLLKLVFKKNVIYDMFEDFPSMVLTREWRPFWLRHLVSRCVHRLEEIACSKLDAVVTADPAVLKQYLKPGRRTGSARRMVFYNFPSLDVFFGKAAVWRRDTEKRYDIVYSGGMSERTGVFVLLDAVEKLAAKTIRPRILMFGYADTPVFKEEFLARARTRGVDDCFEMLGRIPHEQVPLMLMQARIGVVPLQPIPKFLKNIPTKVFEYWACGLPIVASDLPPIRPFFREGQYGHLVRPDSSDEFAEALARLLENPVTAQRMGEQARSAVLTRMNVLPEQRKLVRLYRQIMGAGA